MNGARASGRRTNPLWRLAAASLSLLALVISERLVASSGDPALDAEAVALPRRCSPVPFPPPEFGHGHVITLTVPIRFNR
ncbi:energy transducer TonB [Methylocapsa sp. S129]|uniref:energy transducer TonB family protein n=1 Tax=Methylocapsa sp. S129 TaxID=1641869 RepID=UPI00131DAA15